MQAASGSALKGALMCVELKISRLMEGKLVNILDYELFNCVQIQNSWGDVSILFKGKIS